MKKLYLLLLLIIPSIKPASSQPTLTGPDFNPFIGLSLIYYNFTPFPFDPGPAGANVTWDFSAVQWNDSVNSVYINPATTIHASSFPNATIASQIIGTGFEYLNANNNFMSREGIDAGGVLMPYSDEEKIITYPFTYNSNFTDNYSATFTAGGYIFYREGTVTATADAYGTLMLPWGSVSNVLRIHLVENYTDSTSFSFNTYASDNYIWVTPGTHFYLCNIASVNNQFAGSYLDATSVGINSIDASQFVQVFPNPVSKYLNVNFGDGEKVLRTTITDVMGKVVYASENNSIIQTQQIDVQFLSSGYYFLNIETNEHTLVKKFSKL